MGYYANSRWDATFNSEQDKTEFLSEMEEFCAKHGVPIGPVLGGVEIAEAIGENGDGRIDGLEISMETNGKWFYGSEDIVEALARHAAGAVEIMPDGGTPYLIELDGRGNAVEHQAVITYPTNGPAPMTEAEAEQVVEAISRGEVDATDLMVMVRDSGRWIEETSTEVGRALREARASASASA